MLVTLECDQQSISKETGRKLMCKIFHFDRTGQPEPLIYACLRLSRESRNSVSQETPLLKFSFGTVTRLRWRSSSIV